MVFILETPRWVLWQTVNTQMKCCIMLHFIRVCTVCKDKNNFPGQKYIIIQKHYLSLLQVDVHNGQPHSFVSICMGNQSKYRGFMKLYQSGNLILFKLAFLCMELESDICPTDSVINHLHLNATLLDDVHD